MDHVLVLNRQTIEVQKGNFSSWWENKTKKDAFSQMENEKHQKEIEKLKKAATRTKQWAEKSEKTKIGFDPVKEHDRCISTRAYIGAKTKKMQSRVTQMEHRINREIEEKAGLLKDIEEVEDLKLVSLKHHKQTLIYLREYGLQYKDAQSKVLSDLTFEVKQGDRIVFSGKNGCGKSTLIKVILEKAGYETGQMSNLMEQGELSVASGLRISYINQDTSFLKGSIKDFCRNENLDESLFCALLRKLDMERVQFTKKLEAYSQGQKKKVLIAASLLTPAHLYIWDEPLNYIDVFSRMQIEKLLLSYQPTMILVEHDKAFAQKVGTKIVEF